MKRFALLAAVVLAFVALASTASADQPSQFGRIFPTAPGFTATANQSLADLATSMVEPVAINNPKGTTGGITFFGQFIDHDLTNDGTPQPFQPIDPTTLFNQRTFAFDLDSVYGTGGRQARPDLYDGDKLKVSANGFDLPRNADGSAILGDPRNDENEIISQFHVAILRLHNALIDKGYTFKQAHDTVVNAYRYVVLNDYLPQIVGSQANVNTGLYDPTSTDHPYTPVEFSVAAFRFGHSQVRNAYNINDQSGGVRVFSLDRSVPDLSGGRPLPADRRLEFDNFFSDLPREADDAPALIGRAIDTHISQSLFELPIPGAEASGSNFLAFRNMLRAKFYDVPSYETVARQLGVTPAFSPVFPDGTPLWYGILKEAEVTKGGRELGAVGGRIVSDTFLTLLDQRSGIHKIDKPTLPDVDGGDFSIGDLLTAADNL